MIKNEIAVPAAPAQLTIYAAQSKDPDSVAYNVPIKFRTDSLDPEKLQTALGKMISRHESLRTRFENRGGKIFQVIDASAEIKPEKLENDDFGNFIKPFDLAVSPLFRVGYCGNTLIFVFHHIIVDGGSFPIFFKELNEFYMGREPQDAPVQYRKFAETEIDTSESEKYWLEQFKDDVPELNINTDLPRSEKKSYPGSVVYLYQLVDTDLYNSIKSKYLQLGISPFAFYAAAYSLFISKYSGSDDVVIGVPLSGRSFEFTDTVGMFVNTVPLRTKPAGGITTDEFLSIMEKKCAEAVGSQSFPADKLAEKIKMKPVPGRNPLFDTMFVYQPKRFTCLIFGDKKTEIEPVPIKNAKCDLTFSVLHRKNTMGLMLEYRTDLFMEPTIRRFIESYVFILDFIAKNNVPIKDLPAAPQEQLSVLHGEKVSLPEESIYSVFEKTAKQKSNDVCIITNEKNYIFSEFTNLVELIDSKIREFTGGKKQTIAIIAERSIEMYAAIYAAVRGGNSYMPIDPSYPQERIGYMLENSGAELILAQDKFCSLFNNINTLNVSDIIDRHEIPDVVPPCRAFPDDTAYVIYTSGSTGRPKGVKISNFSLLNRLLWMQKKYPLDENSVILQKTPYTFDVSLWEIFLWGLSGGKMAFMKPDEHFMPSKITDGIYSRKITDIHFVPSVFDLFVSYLEKHPEEQKKISSLRHIFISGETLNASLTNRFYALSGSENIKLNNLYGPTECAVDVTFHDCQKQEKDPLPIGQPIDNTDIFITDQYLHPVPRGVIGEICAGGSNVGQGYVNNDVLTNEVFLSNPFGEGRIYKTGDLGYIDDKNEIIFCGRKDEQIKLNGQRIELGEIENVLSEIDGIDLAAAAVRENKKGNQMLCAFYSGKSKTVSEIKKNLGEKLPHYMIPQIIIRLNEMPLTPSGKIDRRSLPDIDFENSADYDAGFAEPKTDAETALVNAIKKVLKTDRVSTSDNFFELGGDSIQAIFVVSELQGSGFELSAADLTLRKSIAEAALFIKTANKHKYLQRNVTAGKIPFTPIMQLFADENQTVSGSFALSQIFSVGSSGRNEITAALDAITEQHPILRAVICQGMLKIVNRKHKAYNFAVKDLKGEKEYIGLILKEQETNAPLFDTENGPLTDAVLYLTDSGSILRITIHHLAADAVSCMIIRNDILTALEQIRSQHGIKLPAETSSFEEWRENLECHKNSDECHNTRIYWDNILYLLNNIDGTASCLNHTKELFKHLFTLNGTLSEQLVSAANKPFGTHTEELLLAALGIAAYNVSGNRKTGLCIETHGREIPGCGLDVSRTVGWFTSYFPALLETEDSIGRSIINTKEMIRHIPDKGIGYGLLFGKIPDNADIVYNFLGNVKTEYDSISSFFASASVSANLPGKIFINSIILNGKLHVCISANCGSDRNIIEKLGTEYEKQLKEVINYCISCKNNLKTISDFSDSDLKTSELEDFEQLFDGKKENE